MSDTITGAGSEARVNVGIIGDILLIQVLGFRVFHFEGLCESRYINVSSKLCTLRTCVNE